jgi:ABC-type nitrate/sulfonate/bicarbonate transport system substrate-binding protein
MTQSVSYYRTIRLGALALLLFSFSSVTAWSEMARQLRVGVQFGLGYLPLPLYVAKDAGFFEKRLRDEGSTRSRSSSRIWPEARKSTTAC